MTRVGEGGRGPRPAILAAALLALFVLCSCVAGEGVREVWPDEPVTGSVTDPQSNAPIQWLNGTYTTCVDRTGSWSARVSGVAAMENPALSVVKNDSGCKLTITSVQGE